MSTETTTHTQSPARAFLRAASAKLKPLAQEAGKSVNELLTDIYSNRAQAREWDTFKGWKKRGYYVAKGERGFAVWSRPIKADETETDTGTDTATGATDAGESGETKPERESFYVAYIFCAAQVKNREGYTPDGAEYEPTNLIPPHCLPAQPTDTKPAESADTTATDTKPADTKPAATPAQPAPAKTTETPATAQPVKYVQQLALAI